MPIPTPKADEKEQDFVSRCMGTDSMQEYDQEQRAAICYRTYKDKDKQKMAETKSEGDGNHPSSHYLVVEDPEHPSTWHLRVRNAAGSLDRRLMGAAWAALHKGYRGNTYNGPNKQEAISKLTGMYKSEGMDTPGDNEELKEAAPDAMFLADLISLDSNGELLSDVKDGLVRIALAYTGDFERGGKGFSISLQDLKDMAKHLKTREVPIDYEHLSAQPNTPPGHSRAAGWIKAPDKIESFKDGGSILYGWAEFTPAALTAIRNKEYKYFSPEIHWNDEDEEGKNIGTRAAAGALTNRPFLKALPPIEIGAREFPQLLEAVALSESKRLMTMDPGSVHVPGPINENNPKGEPMKKFTVKPIPDGDNKGEHGIFDGDEMIGLVHKASLKKLSEDDTEELNTLRAKSKKDDEELTSMKQKVADLTSKKKDEDEDEDEELKELRAKAKKDDEELAELRKLKARTQKGGDLYVKHESGDDDDDDDTKGLSELVRTQNNRHRDTVCLTEFAKTEPGDKTEALAEKMLDKNQMTTLTFLRQQKISRLVDRAINEGKALPKQRQALYELAIVDFDKVQHFLSEAKAVLDLEVRGIGGEGSTAKTATQELNEKVEVYLTEHKGASRAEALRVITKAEPKLWARHQAASRVMVEDAE